MSDKPKHSANPKAEELASATYKPHRFGDSAAWFRTSVDLADRALTAEADLALTRQQLHEHVETIAKLQADLADAIAQRDAARNFMGRISKELGCLPSFSDPENGNEHIFRALSRVQKGGVMFQTLTQADVHAIMVKNDGEWRISVDPASHQIRVFSDKESAQVVTDRLSEHYGSEFKIEKMSVNNLYLIPIA